MDKYALLKQLDDLIPSLSNDVLEHLFHSARVEIQERQDNAGLPPENVNIISEVRVDDNDDLHKD